MERYGGYGGDVRGCGMVGRKDSVMVVSNCDSPQ